MPPTREAGPAAGQGALAGVIVAPIGGIVNTVAMLIQAAVVGPLDAYSEIPPDMLRQYIEAGGDPQMLEEISNRASRPLGAAFGGSCCCLGGLIVAAILGAIGGAIYAGIKPD